MGAESIKVESITRPDMNRMWPFPDNQAGPAFWNQGSYFNEVNRNKLGITLDLTRAEGKAIFRRLVALSDVVGENYTPRVMAQLGLDYATLSEDRPDLIMVSSSAFGHSGPWRNYRAWGHTLEPTCGLSQVTGYRDGPPARSGIAFIDMPSSILGAFAILACLEDRYWTGRGQWIDLSQYEVGALGLADSLLDFQMNGRTPTRLGNRDFARAPQGVYPCAGDDNWVALSVPDDATWRALCRVCDRPDWAADRRLRTVVGRRQRHEDLDEGLAAWTGGKDRDTVVVALRAAGVPAGPVAQNKAVLLDRHLRARGFFRNLRHPPEAERVGVRPYLGLAWRLSETPGHLWGAAPTLGQHNEYVLGELLGMGRRQIADLETRAVIGTRPPESLLGEAFIQGPPSASLEALVEAGRIAAYDPDFMAVLGIGEPGGETPSDRGS
jgi:crotonobetainyl-CoA:carnitine CoA-transferase CaiB-like acyl-CoA transferase